jgi:hypothetical protein
MKFKAEDGTEWETMASRTSEVIAEIFGSSASLDELGARLIRPVEQRIIVDVSDLDPDVLVWVQLHDDPTCNYISLHRVGDLGFERRPSLVTKIKGFDNRPMPWFGGECPVPGELEVEVWFRGVTEDYGKRDVGNASKFPGWFHYTYHKWEDIIAYHIILGQEIEWKYSGGEKDDD